VIRVNKRKIGEKNPVYIVAEAGINHNSDMKIAKEMIKIASKCGADAIKFQTIIPDELFSERINPDLYKMSKKWFLNKKQHTELLNYAKKNKIEFFSTPFGNKSINILREVGVKLLKIASGDLDNKELINQAASLGIPIIISSGMSTIKEIATTVNFLKKKKHKFILLHCNSSYPTPSEDANLLTIPFLKQKFRVPVGYSDHTQGIEACLAAVSLGAILIEKHFTLNKNMEGPDQKLSSDPIEFGELVKAIRTTEKMIGTHRNGVTNSEKKFRKLMRKSVGTARDLTKGTKIKKSDLTLFRPGTGINPKMLEKLVGKTVKKSVKKGQLVEWNMF